MTTGSSTQTSLGSRFWKVWTAATASNIGDGIVLAAVPLLAAELTREPLGVAATTIAVRLPWLVFGLFAGVIVDRSDRLRLMIGTDAGRAVAFVAIAMAVVADEMTLVILYLSVFAVGVLETIFDTAAMSMTPALVERSQLERANARINGAYIAANEFVGPPLGGALFALAAALPFFADAATFGISVVVLLTVGGRYRPQRVERTSVMTDIRIGFGFLWREHLIRAFAIGAAMINLGSTAALAVLVLHAQDNLGASAFGFGVLLATAAVGGIAGAQAAPAILQALGRRRSVVGSVVGLALGILVMGIASTLWVAGAGFALFGFSGEVWNVASVSYRQSVTPDELLGRVMAGFRVIAYGAFPIGAAVGGVIAQVTSLRLAFAVGAGILGLLVPYIYVTGRRHGL